MGRRTAGTATTTGSSPRPPTTAPRSCTRGTTRAVERVTDATRGAASPTGGLDQQVALAEKLAARTVNLRRIVCDLVEEYGRHTGQADLIREAVDGRVGEDPPPGWRPGH